MENEITKTMPHNKEAEQSVLGCMLVDSECVSTAASRLSDDCFYIEANRQIFSAMMSLYDVGSNVDFVTVGEELLKRDKLDAVGGNEYLVFLATSLPTTNNLKQYIDILNDKAMLRRLINTSSEIAKMSYEPGSDSNEVAEKAGQLIFNVIEKQGGSDIVHIRDVIMKTYENLVEIYQNKGETLGVPTGLADLDSILHGMRKGNFVLIAARPSVGKTSFALNIATHAAIRANVPTAIFSLEMKDTELVSRMISSEMLIDASHLMTGELDDDDWEKIANSLDIIGNAPIYINETSNVTVNGIRTICRRLKHEKNLGLIVIDYLQLMSDDSQRDRQNEISAISRALKVLALELDIPIIALSQLSRASEKRTDHRPMLSDLRDSGAIEQDADIVMFLYKEDNYDKETEQKNIVECIVAKNRAGSTDTAKLYWAGQYTRFMNLKKEG